MKIGIFTTLIYPYDSGSGISNNIYLTARNLEKKGVEMEIFAPMYRGMKAGESFGNVDIIRFPIKEIIKNRYSMCGISDYLKKRKFDLVHSVHYAYPPSEHGFRFARKNNLPHILAASYHSKQVGFWNGIFMKVYNNFIGKNIIKNSDMVLPQNKNEEKELNKIAECKCRIIPAPLNSRVFWPEKKKRGEKFVIGYAGILEGWKGAKAAFEICRQLEKERDDVMFVFIGSGSLEKEFKSSAGKNFTFMKNLPVKNLADMYRAMDVLLCPTYYESFGRIIAEAMMCGTPVISTRSGAVPDTVGNGGLLVDYGRWGEMKSNVNLLLDDEKMRKKLARNAVNHSRQYRDYIVSRKILGVYEELIS
jgi:glycosyltransferase involved in cell wall biosynthesis